MAGDYERGEDLVDESGENLTQQEIGEGEKKPVDIGWDDEEVEGPPQEGEEGQEPVA